MVVQAIVLQGKEATIKTGAKHGGEKMQNLNRKNFLSFTSVNPARLFLVHAN